MIDLARPQVPVHLTALSASCPISSAEVLFVPERHFSANVVLEIPLLVHRLDSPFGNWRLRSRATSSALLVSLDFSVSSSIDHGSSPVCFEADGSVDADAPGVAAATAAA